MKRTAVILCAILFVNCCLLAQKHEPVTIKSGTRVKDYFPISERYLYPEFTKGTGNFKNGGVISLMLNFNLLTCEMEFIQSKDTLYIAKKEEINYIVVAKDTFYYHGAYMQKIRGGSPSVFLKRRFVVKDIRKRSGMGQENRSSSIDSYNFMTYNQGKLSVDLEIASDIVFQKTEEYFFSMAGSDFVKFSKKNILWILPGKEAEIKNYFKTNYIDFESKEDVLNLAGFVSNLLGKNPNHNLKR